MKNKKLVIVLGTIFVAVLFIVGIAFFISKNSNNIISNNDAPISDIDINKDSNGNDIITTDEDGNITYSYTNEDVLAAQEYMDTHNHIYLEYLVTEDVEYEDGTLESNLLNRYISEIYFEQKMNDTKNVTNYTSDQDFDAVERLDFKEAFGFEFDEYTKPFDMMIGFMKAQGFNLDLDNATLDEEIYEQYGEKVYFLEGDSLVYEKILEGIDYDEIVSTGGNYVIVENADGNPALRYINFGVEYIKDNVLKTRIVECGITLMVMQNPEDQITDEAGSDDDSCGCGSDTDCNTGSDNGVGCETDCDSEEAISY